MIIKYDDDAIPCEVQTSGGPQSCQEKLCVQIVDQLVDGFVKNWINSYSKCAQYSFKLVDIAV